MRCSSFQVRTASRLLTLLAACVCTLALAGCWTKHKADPARLLASPQYPSASAWPPRDRNAVLPLLAATKVEVLEPVSTTQVRKEAAFPLSNPDSAAHKSTTQAATSRVARISVRPSAKCGYAAMHGDVLLRLYERDPVIPAPKDAKIDLADVYGFVPNGRIATSRSFEDPLNKLTEENYNGPYVALVDLLHKARVLFEVSADALINKPEAGVPIYIPPPTPNQSRYKGILIHLQSLAPNPFEPRVLEEFRSRGWCVVDIATQSTVLPPITNETQTLANISKQLKAARASDDAALAKIFDSGFEGKPAALIAGLIGEYQQQSTKTRSKVAKEIAKAQSARAFRIPCSNPTDAQVEEVGKAIALQVDNSIAGNAYALEAVLDYIQHQRPDLASLPRVVAGFSAGALITPTGIARVRERFPIAAVVMVGGGVDMFYMSQESTLTDGGLKVLCESNPPNSTREVRPSPTLLERVHNAYLRNSKLDPIYTAAALRGIPVLQVHASWDQWVPYEAGEALWEQLGRPERWDLTGLPPLSGHLALFYLVPGKRKDIADWVERAVFP
ncbi:MAG: hypothetical protein U0640_09195 [Phycisphaerales bacterium]